MSFATVVKDYVDWINADFDSFYRTFGVPMTFWAFLKGNLAYICHLLKIGCIYLLTFQWLRDLVYLPVLIPEMTLDAVRETFAGIDTWDKVPTFAGLSFLGTSNLVQNKVLVGFFNSFFACLPLTFVHFVAIRHLYVKGFQAALAINVGIILGHLFFLSSVIFGWRGLLIPWLHYEPWIYFLQVGLVILYIRDAYYPNRFVVAPVDKPLPILRTVLLGFILTIGDHGVCFRYITSLTGGLEPTFVEPLSSTIQQGGSFVQPHLVYLLSFFLGSLLFTGLFFWIAVSLRAWLALRLRLVEEGWTGLAWEVNMWLGPVCILLFWTCLPFTFYSNVYIWQRPLGFEPYDHSQRLANTLEDRYLTRIDGPPKPLSQLDTKNSLAKKFFKLAHNLPESVGTEIMETLRPKSGLLDFPKKEESLPPRNLVEASKNRFLPILPDDDSDLAHYNQGVLYRPQIWMEDTRQRPWMKENYRLRTSDMHASITDRNIDKVGNIVTDIWKAIMVQFSKGFQRFLRKVIPAEKLPNYIYGESDEAVPKVPKGTTLRINKGRSKQKMLTSQKLRINVFRVWLAANLGQGSDFDQFRVYNDFISPLDPYDSPHKNPEDAALFDEMDSLIEFLQEAKGEVNPETLDAAKRINTLFRFYVANTRSGISKQIFQQLQQKVAGGKGHQGNDHANQENLKVLDNRISPISSLSRDSAQSRIAALTLLTSAIFQGQTNFQEGQLPDEMAKKSAPVAPSAKESGLKFRLTDQLEGAAKAKEEGEKKDEDEEAERMKASNLGLNLPLTVWPRVLSYRFPLPLLSNLKTERYYNRRLRFNFIEKLLLRFDIDRFLARQPKGQLLTVKEEKELYFKRLMLKNLVQTNAKYRRAFWENPKLRQVFYGTKTMANKVYNHQFLGTYSSIRDLMRVDFNLKAPTSRQGRVLKYDMPLFTGDKSRFTSFHEELISEELQQWNKYSKRHQTRLKFGAYQRILHPGNTRPFYAGWDEDRRAFVLTNRFLPARVASRIMPLNEDYPQFASLSALAMETKPKRPFALSRPTEPTEPFGAKGDQGGVVKGTKRIVFTTWPISSKVTKDRLRYREAYRALMGNRPEEYQTELPSLRRLLAALKRFEFPAVGPMMERKILIKHFIPDYDFRPSQILFEEINKPSNLHPRVHEKLARRRAADRFDALPTPPKNVVVQSDFAKTEFVTTDLWPSGFYTDRTNQENVWWFDYRSSQPFADRGGYVWPSHHVLKVRFQNYLPRWISRWGWKGRFFMPKTSSSSSSPSSPPSGRPGPPRP